MPADKTAIVLIAYGSCQASGLAALRQFEARVRGRYPGMPVRWAYTSEHIRTRLAEEVRLKSDSVVKAIRRLALERFDAMAAQPLQIVSASENVGVEDMAQTVSRELGVAVRIGAPLLATDGDVALAAQAAISHLPADRGPGEDVIFVGHGTKSAVQGRYAQLARAVAELDPAVHVVTLSGNMSLESLLPGLSSDRVWLMPLLSTVGKHTLQDIAGNQPDSLRSCVERAGHRCEAVLEGVLENRAFADIWLAHLDAAMAGFGKSPVPEA